MSSIRSREQALAVLDDASARLVELGAPDHGWACMEETDALLRVQDRLALSIEHRVAHVDKDKTARVAGFSSTSAWLRNGARMGKHHAGQVRRNATQFARLPRVADAVATGRISHDMAAAIAAVTNLLKKNVDVSDTESILLKLALDPDTTPEKIGIVGRHLREVLDPDGSLSDEEKAHSNRYLSVHVDEHGGMSGRFYLPPEAAARLQAILDKYARVRDAADAGPEGRTQAQRNADALIQFLNENVSAEILVLVNAETLPDDHPAAQQPEPPTEEAGDPDTPATILPTGHVLPAKHVRRLLYTSNVYRVVLDAKARVIDASYAVRLVPDWMRRLTLTQYPTCGYDGCTVEANRCEMDHVYNWAQFNRTRADEIIPACSYHNRDRATHPNKYQLHKAHDGRWLFKTTGRQRR
jgi:hypothetical protein